MKSLKNQLAVALIAVLAVGAFTVGCNKTETAGDNTPGAATATTNAVDTATSTNK